MTNYTDKIINELITTLKPFDKIDEFSNLPGIYFIGFNGENFPFPSQVDIVSTGDIIYVGKTEKSQKSRDANTHFKSGKTGSSTLRRSVGAILRNKLELKPIPRSQNEIKMRDFKFIEESEKKLTKWMIKNLSLSFYEVTEGKRYLKLLENQLIELLTPILNISKNKGNPFLRDLKELRRQCRDIAVTSKYL